MQAIEVKQKTWVREYALIILLGDSDSNWKE
jgi:hypothetical protein